MLCENKTQSVGDDLEEGVARSMAVIVIHILEFVDVNGDDVDIGGGDGGFA